MKNHKADIKNSNLGTDGFNSTYLKAQKNKKKQLSDRDNFIDRELEFVDEGYFAFNDD